MTREIKADSPHIIKSTSFDEKHTLEFNEKTHRYKLDGQSCPSVTTMLKAGYPTSMGIINWFKRQTSIALYDTLSTLRFGEAWPTTEEEKKEIFKKAESAHEGVAQEAADIGTVVHGFSELWSQGKTNEADALLDKVRGVEKWPLISNCISQFLDWYSKNKGELVSVEALVASPTHLFAGKFDRLDRVNGKLRLRDYKTSKAIFLDMFIQLGTYKLGFQEWSNLNIEELEIIRFGKEDGAFETLLITDPKEIQMFVDQGIRCRQTVAFMKMNDDERFDWRSRGKA